MTDSSEYVIRAALKFLANARIVDIYYEDLPGIESMAACERLRDRSQALLDARIATEAEFAAMLSGFQA